MPAASVATTFTVPDVSGPADVTAYLPAASAVAVPVVPSGNVTATFEPGSAVPETVSVPLAFGVVVIVGADGAVVSA